MREIIFDTETTGVNPAGGDRIVEIGCIEMINRVETGREYHAYFHPERSMPSEAEAVHGLSDRFLSDKPLFKDKAQELIDFLGDAPMVAHNAEEIDQLLRLVGEQWLIAEEAVGQAVDRLGLARHRPFGVEVRVIFASGLYPVDHFDAADFDDAVAPRRVEAGRFRVEHYFAHVLLSTR